jgi:hypothetical protein
MKSIPIPETRVFDVTKKHYEVIMSKDYEPFMNYVSEPYEIEYKGHVYMIDSNNRSVKHVSGNERDGALYYGYSYLTEIVTGILYTKNLWDYVRSKLYLKEPGTNVCKLNNGDEQNQICRT